MRGSYSSVINARPAAAPGASQIVLYPPSVPISRIRRAPRTLASRCSSLPWFGATLMDGKPGRVAGREGGLKRGVLTDQLIGEVMIDFCPYRLRHDANLGFLK